MCKTNTNTTTEIYSKIAYLTIYFLILSSSPCGEHSNSKPLIIELLIRLNFQVMGHKNKFPFSYKQRILNSRFLIN